MVGTFSLGGTMAARTLAVIAASLAFVFAAFAADPCGKTVACAIEGGEYFAAAPGNAPVGAVLFLHGWGGNAKADIARASLVEPLVARGYVVVAPVGLPYSADEPTTSWNAEKDPANRDDVAFIDAVMNDAAARFSFPRDHVLASGFSLGGMMIWRLACDAPGDYAAFAPVAGTFWRPMPETCAGPARIFHVHGWADRMVPLEGRPIEGTIWVQGDVFAALAVARRTSGCAAKATHEVLNDMEVRSWVDCTSGNGVTIALHHGGHKVPQGWADLALDWFEGAAPPEAVACRKKTEGGGKC